MVLQSIELGDDYQLLDPIPDPTPDQAFFPRTGSCTRSTARCNPTLRMYPGEVQRWRLLNAAEGKFMSLHLAPARLPRAGLGRPDAARARTRPSPDAVGRQPGRGAHPGRPAGPLPPGPDAGLQPAPRHPRHAGLRLGRGAGPAPWAACRASRLLQGELDPRTILTVEVAGDGRTMGLPTGLPAFDPPILPIARRREFAFTVQGAGRDEFLNFGIDGVPFDPARPPYRPVLGTAEEWTLTQRLRPEAHGQHAHVFHIHTNPFRITRRNGKALDPPLWRDTYVLTKAPGDTITFESNFVDYPGRFVEHCHIVSHEDLGMMSEIEIVRR